MKIALVIPSLAQGGAEGQLVLLANGLARRGHEVLVVPLAGGGALESALRDVRLIDLGKRSKFDLPRTYRRLTALLLRERPDVLHSYLPTANILAGLCGALFPRTRVVFGLRASNVNMADLGASGRLAYGLERLMAHRASLIIANSIAGMRHAVSLGYPVGRLRVVHNAVDPAQFTSSPEAASALRALWGVQADETLVGVPARLDPMKGHLDMVRAAELALPQHPGMRFAFIGGGQAGYTAHVQERIASAGLLNRIVMPGPLADMGAGYAAMDMLCLPSAYGEGFPNVVAEGLTCGVPCVVTEVGDSPLLAQAANQAGIVVPPSNPQALAQGLCEMARRLDAQHEALAAQARTAAAGFSPERLARHTEALLQELL